MFPLIMAQMLWFLDVQAMENGKDLIKTEIGYPVAGGVFNTQTECTAQGRDRLSELKIATPEKLRNRPKMKFTFTCTKRTPPPPLTLEQLKAIHDAGEHAHHNMPGM